MSRHAYLIIAYHQWELLKTLIQLIDDERNDIFIHIDNKIADVPTDEISSAAKKSEVIFTERLPIYRGTYVISKAELLLLKTALNHGEYRYFHLISGQDLPLKTQNEIHSFFDEMDGYNFIDLIQPNQLKKGMREGATLYNLFIKESFAKKGFVALILRNANRATKVLQRMLGINRFAKYEIEGYEVAYGSSWFSITDGFAIYLANHEDIVEQMITLQTHDHVLFFTNKGKVYRIKGYEIPEFSRQAKGLPVINLLPIEKGEYVKAILPIRVEKGIESKLVTFVTRKGSVKRTYISEFENIRKTGKIAISLREDDELLSVMLTNGNDELIISANNGRMVRFNENEIRILGRTASGVKGIDIQSDVNCVSAEVINESDEILIVTENGYGKRTNVSEYRLTHRGSKGVKAMNITDKNGSIVSVNKVEEDSDLIIITNSGIIIRIPLEQVSKMSRVTQGIRLISLKDNQKVATVTISKKEVEEDSENQDIDNNQN